MAHVDDHPKVTRVLDKYPSPALRATSPTRGEVILRPNLILRLTPEEKQTIGMDTSPLVGEVAQRAGEGYFSSLLHTFLAEGWWDARNCEGCDINWVI